MKTKNVIISVLFFSASLILQSCSKDEVKDIQDSQSSLPSSFRVDIPSSISKPADYTAKKSSEITPLSGNIIYEHLTNFIHVGEVSSEIVEEMIHSISAYEINKAMELSYTSPGDNRDKKLVVVEQSTFENKVWEFEMIITDAESETQQDGGIGLHLYWDRNPVKGIAICKPNNFDRVNNDVGQAIFRIDYSEAGELNYDAHMIVSIVDLPLPDTSAYEDAKYAVKNMKMFAGKKGDIIDVYGNSDHPNASFLSEATGFNWAFAASCKESEDISVAEVGLPPSNFDSYDRTKLLEENSIENIFKMEIYRVWPTADSTLIDAYLSNTTSPGFFNSHGFIQGGSSPSSSWDELILNIKDLTPYNPKNISEMNISLK
ncbi:MAG: hypothetical protein ACOCUL_02470 [Bacteroidota bacterium]